MTLAELKKVLDISLNRDDLRPHHEDWVNQAMTRIYQDYSWNCMRHTADVTIPSGSSFISLPSDFKELTPARPPIHLVGSDNGLTPCEISRREDLIRNTSSFGPSTVGASTPVFLSSNGTDWTLNVISAATSDATFRVSYFRLLPELAADEDSNYITRTYPEMVKAKLKAIAFDETNDPLATVWETKYTIFSQAAARDDSKRWTRGRVIRMGGE